MHGDAANFRIAGVIHGRDWPRWNGSCSLRPDPRPGSQFRIYAGLYVRGRRRPSSRWTATGTAEPSVARCPGGMGRVPGGPSRPTSRGEIGRGNVEKIAPRQRPRPLGQGRRGRGSSLMAGLLRCRRCGHRLQARYSARGVPTCASAATARTRAGRGAWRFPRAAGVVAGRRDPRGGRAGASKPQTAAQSDWR